MENVAGGGGFEGGENMEGYGRDRGWGVCYRGRIVGSGRCEWSGYPIEPLYDSWDDYLKEDACVQGEADCNRLELSFALTPSQRLESLMRYVVDRALEHLWQH